MARIGSKGPKLHVVCPGVAYALDKVSKAALIDLYVQALAANLGACDTAPTLEEVRADADPTLRLRGDRLVISEERVYQYEAAATLRRAARLRRDYKAKKKALKEGEVLDWESQWPRVGGWPGIVERATSAKYVVEGSGAHLLTRETEETD